MDQVNTPVLGIIAPSGGGKTTLLKQVIGLLNQAGWRIGVIKQARDDFDLDQPGKDSYELRKAGIRRLLLASERQSALVLESTEPREVEFAELLALLNLDELDLVLVEGFRDCAFAKIEIIRCALQQPPYYPHDPSVIALATDTPQDTHLPQLDLNQAGIVAEFIQAWMQTEKTKDSATQNLTKNASY